MPIVLLALLILTVLIAALILLVLAGLPFPVVLLIWVVTLLILLTLVSASLILLSLLAISAGLIVFGHDRLLSPRDCDSPSMELTILCSGENGQASAVSGGGAKCYCHTLLRHQWSKLEGPIQQSLTLSNLEVMPVVPDQPDALPDEIEP